MTTAGVSRRGRLNLTHRSPAGTCERSNRLPTIQDPADRSLRTSSRFREWSQASSVPFNRWKKLAIGNAASNPRCRPGEPEAAAADRSAMARPAARRRLSPPGGRRGHPDHSVDARPRQHSADAALPECDGRRTQTRIGGELEKPRPTAATGIRKLGRCRCLCQIVQNLSQAG